MKIKLTKKDLIVIVGTVSFLLIGSTISYIVSQNSAPSVRFAGMPPAEQYVPKINDTFRDGNFAYTITEAKRNGGTVTVKAHAENIAKKAETLYGGSMKLRDSNGNFYDSKFDGLAKGTVNPGLETEGEITFEVPEDATGLMAAVNTDVIATVVANALDNDVDYILVDIGL